MPEAPAPDTVLTVGGGWLAQVSIQDTEFGWPITVLRIDRESHSLFDPSGALIPTTIPAHPHCVWWDGSSFLLDFGSASPQATIPTLGVDLGAIAVEVLALWLL